MRRICAARCGLRAAMTAPASRHRRGDRAQTQGSRLHHRPAHQPSGGPASYERDRRLTAGASMAPRGRGESGVGGAERGASPGQAADRERAAPAIAAGQRARAIPAMIVAMASFACGDTLMKLASMSLPTSQLLFIRGSFVLCGVACRLFHWSAPSGAATCLRARHGGAAVGDIGGGWLFQMALARMPYADCNGHRPARPDDDDGGLGPVPRRAGGLAALDGDGGRACSVS